MASSVAALTLTVLAPLAGATTRQADSWVKRFWGHKAEPRQVSGRLILKGGTPLVGWTVSGSATKSSMGVSATEGIPVTTDASGAFAYEKAMTGWVCLGVKGPWGNGCFSSTRAFLNPEETEAEIVVDAYLLQAQVRSMPGSWRGFAAQPILRSNAFLGEGWTDLPAILFALKSHAGIAKSLVPAGASYLVTKQRPGKRPHVAIVDGATPASIIDIDFQESLPSLATFTVSTTGGEPMDETNLKVELRPVWDPAAPVCTPRAVDLKTGTYRGVALPGRYRVVSWVANRVRPLHFVEGAAERTEITLEAGKDTELTVSSAPAGGIEVYPNWPSDFARAARLKPHGVRAEVRLAGTKEWEKTRLLRRSWALTRAPMALGPMTVGLDSFILERALAPGEYQVRLSLPDRVSEEATVTIRSTADFTPCHLFWE